MIRILHCHSTFAAGGKEARAVRLMNAFGDAARHTVISAVPGAMAARDAIDAAVRAEFPDDHPSLTGPLRPGRYRTLAEYLTRFDLVLTYNWGAMDAVMARRIFARDCPPLVHHEDGFNADEAVKLSYKRNVFRRFALTTAHGVAVPSTTLAAIARDAWGVPSAKLHRIANGIDVKRYAKPIMAIPGLKRSRDEVVIGTLAGLRPVKNLPRLVAAVAPIRDARLVIVGDGPERDAIVAAAAAAGMADRLVMPGHLAGPHRYIGNFDVFALSSDSEQQPISLIEAMAAGLPCVATDVGDVRAMVADANKPFIAPVADETAFRRALNAIAGDVRARRSIGAANRAKALTDFDETTMIARYRTLYSAALGRSL